MLYYLFFSLLLSISIIYNYTNKLTQVPIIQEVWIWDKRDMSDVYGKDNRNSTKENSPHKALNGYFTSFNKPYIFSAQKTFYGDDNDLFELPVLGNGYLSFKKIGDKITYFSKNGEVLWKKSYQSYPFSTPIGNIHYLVSGDGNQVLVIDINGNLTGSEQLDGRFLTDISNTVHSGSILLFSGGELYRLDSNGKLIYRNDEADPKVFHFFKSSALSENGLFSTVHFMEKESDFINTYDDKRKLLYQYKLDSLYSHKIFMAVSNSGEVLLNLRDKIIILSAEGKELIKNDKKKKEDVYQLSYSNGQIFSANFNENLIFFSKNGEVIKKKKFISNKTRIFSGKTEDIFFVESSNNITQMKVFTE